KGKGKEKTVERDDNALMASDDERFNCCICFDMLDRPIPCPCRHNLYLKCFVQSIKKLGKRNCPVCGSLIPCEMADQPRIN
ncbi:Zinc finger, RING/FYVE/PHD-type, partial [Corchorus capsularis]